MTFIEAVLLIPSCGLWICSNGEEHAGEHDVCVYTNDESHKALSGGSGFVGKLRWPRPGRKAEVDEYLVEFIKERFANRQISEDKIAALKLLDLWPETLPA